MADLKTKYNFTNNTQDVEEITDAKDVTISLGSDIKNNSLRITMKNDPINVFSDGVIRHRWVDNDGLIKFRAVKANRGEIIDEELVDIYATYTETDPSINVESDEFLLFTGVINEGKVKYSKDKHDIELRCKDRNVIILDKLTIPQAFTKDGSINTSPLIIQQLIRNGSENSKSNSQGFDTSGNKALGNPFLIDARLFSEGIKSNGTTTSGSSRKLIDSGASFESDGVVKDDWVRNTTDNTYAFIISVDSQTQLTLAKDVMDSGEGYQVSDGFIQDTRSDGSSFPSISFSQINKPIVEGILKLSQTDRTNTATEKNPTTGSLVIKRGMRMFIDKNNRFHWYSPSDTPEHVFEVGATAAISPDTSFHRIFDVEMDNKVRNEVNFIIFKAGEDMNDLMIKSFARAPFSGRPNTKEALRQWVHIARDMKTEDEQAGNIVKTSSDTYAFPVSYNPLPDGNTYPSWDSIQDTIPVSDATYNASFKTEAINRGKSLAQAIFQKQANPRWAGKIMIRGEPLQVGDLIQFTSKTHGIINVLVRIIGITHNITPEAGWISSIQIEEDENELTVGL